MTRAPGPKKAGGFLFGVPRVSYRRTPAAPAVSRKPASVLVGGAGFEPFDSSAMADSPMALDE